MVHRIVDSRLHYQFLLVAIVAVMMFFGIARLRDVPVDVFPEFAPPVVEVQTEALGLSAAEVESPITLYLAELLSVT